MKDLREFAPDGLVAALEGLPCGLGGIGSEIDESKVTPFKVVCIRGAWESVFLRVRSPKHKFTIFAASHLLRANPELAEFLGARVLRTIQSVSGHCRGYTLSPKEAPALSIILASLRPPVSAGGAAPKVPIPGWIPTGSANVSFVEDWCVSKWVGPAAIIDFGHAIPSVVVQGGRVFLMASGFTDDETLAWRWVTSGGMCYISTAQGFTEINRMMVMGRAWICVREVPQGEEDSIKAMLSHAFDLGHLH